MVKKRKEKVKEDKWVKKIQKREEERKRSEIKKKREEKPKEEVKRKKLSKKEEKIKEKEVEEKVKGKKEKPIELIKFYDEKGRKVNKKKKPKFIRQEFKKLKKLKKKWRKPRGIDSKKVEKKRGKGKIPSIGYKNPKKIRGLVKGYRVRVISNPGELSNVKQKGDAIIISGKVGRKKRNEIIKEANKLKLIILNPRKGEIKK